MESLERRWGMGKRVELYECKSVPNRIPEFIDPHITVDEDFDGNEVYIIEVDVSHIAVIEAKKRAGGLEKLLEEYGIMKPQLEYAGERPDFV
jgi:hypothetical protein